METFSKEKTIYCPKIQDYRTVNVEYYATKISGSLSEGGKAKNTDCEDREQCKFAERECPAIIQRCN